MYMYIHKTEVKLRVENRKVCYYIYFQISTSAKSTSTRATPTPPAPTRSAVTNAVATMAFLEMDIFANVRNYDDNDSDGDDL